MNTQPFIQKVSHVSRKIHGSHVAVVSAFLILIAAGAFASWYGYNRLQTLTDQIELTQNKLASTTDFLTRAITQSHNSLSSVINDEKQNVGTIQNQLGTYQQQVGSLSGTLTTLQKLSKTDPQLLEKYSKVFFLNEHYAPAELTSIPDDYKYSDLKHPQISSAVWPFMKRMIDDALASNVKLYVYSGYRSFSEQSALKTQYRVVYGSGSANAFSADQGYSEHQLGTTADFITPGLGGELDGFDTTAAYNWLVLNAYKYGFELSYPKNNSYYVFEPWHWRFVGVKLATDLHTANQNFYDWDQRKIDGYLVNLFD